MSNILHEEVFERNTASLLPDSGPAHSTGTSGKLYLSTLDMVGIILLACKNMLGSVKFKVSCATSNDFGHCTLKVVLY